MRGGYLRGAALRRLFKQRVRPRYLYPMLALRLTFESLRFAWDALRGNVLRTVLSLLGDRKSVV